MEAQRARVLVIDDDPFIGRTVTRSLSRDHDVVSTVRGQELLERLEGGERFDVEPSLENKPASQTMTGA